MKFQTSFILLTVLLLSVLSSCGQKTVETQSDYEIVDLPDGSWVYMNQNSSISYDTDFEDRVISIEGEVFIHVKADQGKPFLVESKQLSIFVTGTEFYVDTNEDESSVEVKEGTVKVKVDDEFEDLKAGEKASVKKGQKGIKKGKAELTAKRWAKDLEIEFKKLGKEIKHLSKDLEKEMKKAGKELEDAGKEIDKEAKKLGKDLQKGLKKITN